MGIVIYRKSDNKVMLEVIQHPLFNTEVFDRFIETVGHKASEYEKLEITADEMPQAMQKEIIIVDGQITFGEDKNPVVLELVIPSEADALTDYIVDVDYRVTMIELGL